MPLRPPAVPLVTHDPYFSAWSFSNALTDDTARHWTGTPHGMCGLIRIDGQTYRIIGRQPDDLPAQEQTAVTVWPTRTVYEFQGAGVSVTLTFCSPLLPEDLDILARPVTYLTWDIKTIDGKTHDIALYLDIQSEWAVNTTDQKVISSRFQLPGLDTLRVGTTSQAILEKVGDNVRIDWGYLYLAAPQHDGLQTALTPAEVGRDAFVKSGHAPEADEIAEPRRAGEWRPSLACSYQLGSVGSETVSRHVLLAYDDLFSLEYLHRRLRPYWRRNDMDAASLITTAEADYEDLTERCRVFDEALMADLTQVGGEEYATLCALAFRQCIAAHKLAADFDGTPIFFSKENYSNGSVNTVDVTYPSAPFFLLFNPALLWSQVKAIMDYAQTPRWKFPFAPHDLGTYPLANGQTYGGGESSEEDQMPVEECGNMLILIAALVKTTGDTHYAGDYWPLLTQWAEYLRDKGLDPENQLCTDDFAGHLAHNVNLSLKAILGLGGYAQMAQALGHSDTAAHYRQMAEDMAQRWQEMAEDGDHTRLAFDKPGTWSQKYNLVWDTLLDLNLFPPSVAAREIAFYKTQTVPYGLPLDSRSPQTKLDWEVWVACLADSEEDFRAFIAPLYHFAQETPTRVPLTDWYDTQTGKMIGFQARSVVGGIYIKMLFNAELWKKWKGRVKG